MDKLGKHDVCSEEILRPLDHLLPLMKKTALSMPMEESGTHLWSELEDRSALPLSLVESSLSAAQSGTPRSSVQIDEDRELASPP